jgi:hypothetical protein
MLDDIPKNHEKLVKKLSQNLKPARPINKVILYTAWLIPTLAIVVWVVYLMGLRTDIPNKITTMPYASTLLILLISGTVSAWAAIKMAIPGEKGNIKLNRTLLAIPVLLIIFVLSSWFNTHHIKDFVAGIQGGHACMYATFAIALIPLVLLTYFIVKLAPLKTFSTGIFITLSALFMASFAVQLHCHSDNACHLSTWHFLPILIGSILIALPLQYLLGKWKRS